MSHEVEASPRDRILAAAARLLAEGGREAVTVRAISAEAHVQAPTIYRQFGDMRGLLAEVASQGFAAYLDAKATQQRTDDPVEDLRNGWDLHVAFGLANPVVYALTYGDPRPGLRPAAARQARGMLRDLVQRVAEAGRLRVGVDHVVDIIDAADTGVVLHLLASAPQDRDHALSPAVREAVLAATTTDAGEPDGALPAGPGRASSRAVALKAVLPEVAGALTPAELRLLSEWLDRLT